MRSESKFMAAFVALGAGIFFGMLAPSLALADALGSAEQAAAKGNWDEAERHYAEAYRQDPSRSAAFFYNYGTAALRNNQAGAASVLLYKASLASPLDTDTRANLRLSRGKLSPAVSAIQPAAWISWLPSATRAIPYRLWWVAALAALALFLAIGARSVSAAWRASLGVVAGLFLLSAAVATWDQRFDTGGVTKLTKILSGPALSFPEIVSLEAGSLLSVEEERPGWRKVRYLTPTGQEVVGWVEASALISI